jgi:hypothetical protein
MQAMQQVTYTAKGLVGLVAGWALGHGLLWGAVLLGSLLQIGYADPSDRALLGSMLLAICMLAIALVAAGLAEMRRVPAWLTTFLLGMATAPVLTVLGFVFFVWTWSD